MEQVKFLLFNRLLYEVVGFAPAVIMMIFFCKVKIFPLLEELPHKIIPYIITERKCAQ